MITSGVTSRITVRTFQYHVRRLSIQQTINKSSSFYYKVNSHNKNDNRTAFTISKTLFQKDFNLSPVFIYSKRNITTIPDEIFQIKDFSQFNQKGTGVVEEAVDNSIPFIMEVVHNASENFFVKYILQNMMELNYNTGLPWWGTIAITAVIFRMCICLPLAVNQMHILARLEKANIDLEAKTKIIKKNIIQAKIKHNWSEKLADEKLDNAIRREWLDMLDNRNCRPIRTLFLVSIQSSLWISATAATWLLCIPEFVGPKVANEMVTGGFGWITNLTEPDQIVLPFALALVNLSLIEIHKMFKVVNRTKSEQWKALIFRVLSIALIPAAAHVPAAVSLYWLSSSTYGVLQAFTLNSSKMRRIFRVPSVNPELKHPYRFFIKNFKSKFQKPTKVKAVEVK